MAAHFHVQPCPGQLKGHGSKLSSPRSLQLHDIIRYPGLVEEFDTTSVDAETYEEGPTFNSLDPVGIGRSFRLGRAEVEVDRAVAQAVQRTVAVIALGLWGATTAAAISLALSAAVGGQPKEWLVYVLIVSGALGLWNTAAFLHYLRQFRRLEGNTQRRLLILVASKIGVKGVVIIAVPVAALLALGTARLLL